MSTPNKEFPQSNKKKMNNLTEKWAMDKSRQLRRKINTDGQSASNKGNANQNVL